MAIASNPRLLIADEPTTALDATTQAQILALLGELHRDLDMGPLLITHDLGVVAEQADRVLVMHDGRVLEEAGTAQLFSQPVHPYSRGLLGASWRKDTLRHYRRERLAEIRVTPRAGGGHDSALREKTPGACPVLGRVHLFTGAALLSLGKLSGDIPGISHGASAWPAASSRAGTPPTWPSNSRPCATTTSWTPARPMPMRC